MSEGTTILIGDVRDALACLPDESVDCVVTSPPYWGLRDYGVAGQIGMEPSLGEHLDVLVAVFREVRRVMKPAATLWLNYGDCYASSVNGRSAEETKAAGGDDRTFRDKPFSTVGPIDRTKRNAKRWGGGNAPQGPVCDQGGILKPKDLVMAANRLAIALQDDGWWVRSEIVWAKPNPMPESVTDRPATAHEKIFLLTKSPRYHYDAEAVRVKAKSNPRDYKTPDGWDTGPGSHGSFHRKGREKGKKDKQRGHGRRHEGLGDRWDGMTKQEQQENGRNLRNVWTIATAPFSEAHFATFPPALVEPCIKAGCAEGGVVLDPFGGAGTVGLVADRLQRRAILVELNPDYAAIAKRRINEDMGSLFGGRVTTAVVPKRHSAEEGAA